MQLTAMHVVARVVGLFLGHGDEGSKQKWQYGELGICGRTEGGAEGLVAKAIRITTAQGCSDEVSQAIS
jgi:hypothetical protein